MHVAIKEAIQHKAFDCLSCSTQSLQLCQTIKEINALIVRKEINALIVRIIKYLLCFSGLRFIDIIVVSSASRKSIRTLRTLQLSPVSDVNNLIV